MTKTMPRTSAEIPALRHKTLYLQAIKKQKKNVLPHYAVTCGITPFNSKHCKVEIHTPPTQIFKQFDMHVKFNIFLDKKSPACKISFSQLRH